MDPSPKANQDPCAEFLTEGHVRYRNFLDTGRAISWEAMDAWLSARAAGKAAPRPAAEQLSDEMMRVLRAEYDRP